MIKWEIKIGERRKTTVERGGGGGRPPRGGSHSIDILCNSSSSVITCKLYNLQSWSEIQLLLLLPNSSQTSKKTSVWETYSNGGLSEPESRYGGGTMAGVYISFISLAFLLQAHYFYIVYISFISFLLQAHYYHHLCQCDYCFTIN